jgi:GrpB-like predicted nucleotidyltransferase (UPF0157 family)
MEGMHFFLSDLIADKAKAAYDDHAKRIRQRLPNVEVCHVGGSSVPGLLTSGDVDLQVRVTEHEYGAACEALCEMYEPMYRERWRESAYFYAASSDPRVEIALTVIGNIDDLHHGESWQRIATDPALIERYNALKRSQEGRSLEDYQAAKREFFYGNFQLEADRTE